MADTALPALQAVVNALKASSAVNVAVGGRVYSDVPQGCTFPYIEVSVDSEPFAAKDFSGQTHTIRVQIRSAQPGKKECLSIRRDVVAALDRQEDSLSLSSGHLVKCEYSGGSTAFKEDDGRVWQAVCEFEADVD